MTSCPKTATVVANPHDEFEDKPDLIAAGLGIDAPRSSGRGVTEVIRNVGWSFLNEGCRAASIAFVVILLARHLGPTDYGVFVFGLSIVKIGWVLATFGLDRVLVRAFVLRPDTTRCMLGQGLTIKATADGASYVLLLAMAAFAFQDEPAVRSVVCLSGLMLFFQPFDAFDHLFQARERLKLTFFGRTVPTLLGAGLKVFAMAFGASLFVFAFLEALTAALVAIGLFAVYWATMRKSVMLQNRKAATVGSLLGDGLPLLISAFSVIIYMRSDLIMIGAIVGKEQTGIYAAAAQVSELWNIIPIAIAPAVLPFLLRQRQHDVKSYERRLALLLQIIAAAGIVIALAVSALAGSIVSVLYGDAYDAATPILRLHAWSLLFVFLGVVQNLWHVGEKFFWTTSLRTTLGALVNIVLNLVLIPDYGGLGAALATVVSYAVSGLLFNAFFSKTRKLFAMQLKALSLVPLIRTLATSIRSNAL